MSGGGWAPPPRPPGGGGGGGARPPPGRPGPRERGGGGGGGGPPPPLLGPTAHRNVRRAGVSRQRRPGRRARPAAPAFFLVAARGPGHFLRRSYLATSGSPTAASSWVMTSSAFL